MRNIARIIFILLIVLLIAGCDKGRPLTTMKLEGVLPDTFGLYKQGNLVRNSGSGGMSEVIGHYTADSGTIPQGLGAGGEIRIVVQDWGATEKSAHLPVAENSENYDYHGLKVYPGFTPGVKFYQVRIPVADRILVRIEYDDIGGGNEREILDAIHWDYLAKILPTWGGLQQN